MLIKEQNAIRKKWTNDKVTIALMYPNTYRTAMTSLGVQLLYFLFNGWDNFICERVFKPLDPNIPPYSLENSKTLKDFDIIAISCQFEFDYVEAMSLLTRAGINPDVRKRTKNDPLIIVGGPSATVNPFPVLFMPDIFFLGDFEPVADRFREALSQDTKNKRIEELLNIEGVIGINNNYDEKANWIGGKVTAVKIKDFSKAFYPIRQIIPENVSGTKNQPIFGKAFYLETDRGCNQRCNFCLVGHNRFPRTGRTLKQLMDIIDKAVEYNNFDKVVIYGSAVAQSGFMDKLLEYITSKDLKVSCSSFRADYITEDILKNLQKGGQKTLTLAPETGDEKLRLDLHKRMYDSEINDAVKIAWDMGFRNLKFYMIYGFPCEHEESTKKIVDFTKKIRQNYFPTGRISISANQFISKANTPLQFAPMISIKESNYIKKVLKKELFQIKNTTISFYQPEWAAIQKILSLGTADHFPLVLEIANKKNTIGNWKRAIKRLGSSFDIELAKHYKIDEQLPWDNIKHNLSKLTIISAFKKYTERRGCKSELL